MPIQAGGRIVDIRGMAVAVEQRTARRVGWKRLGRARLPIIAGVASLLVFAIMQVDLLSRSFRGQQEAWASGRFPPSAFFPGIRAVLEHPSWIPGWLRFPYGVWWTGSSLLRFVAFAAVTTAVAAWGPRWTFWIPVTLWAVGPPLFGLIDGPYEGSRLAAPPFSMSIYAPRSHVWLVAGFELALVSLPGLVVSLQRGATPRVATDRALLSGAFALCAGVFVLWQSTAAAASGDAGATWTSDLARVLPLFALGALLPFARRSWLVLAGAVALYWWLWQAIVVMTGPLRLTPLSTFVTGIAPFAFAAFLGAAWRPLAAGLRRLEDRPWSLFAIANGLNVADAAVTWVFLRTGQIEEANPVVRGIGLPAKVILVGVLTWLLLRTRPRALVWPILILAFVMAWDVAGIVLGHAMGV